MIPEANAFLASVGVPIVEGDEVAWARAKRFYIAHDLWQDDYSFLVYEGKIILPVTTPLDSGAIAP